MRVPDHLLLRAEWGGRVDPLETQIAMVWNCFQRFAKHGEFFSGSWFSLRPPRGAPVPDFAALEADMTDTWNNDDSYGYSFAQNTLRSYVASPGVHDMSVNIANPEGWDTMAGNSVVASFEVDDNVRKAHPLPVKWLLEIGVDLVKDFVDVWKPDVVSLDSLELLELMPEEGAYPTVGYFSWLSSSVVGLDALPAAPVREPYKNGMLLGIHPYSRNPIHDATKLAKPIYASGILGLIPFVQGRPNPQ